MSADLITPLGNGQLALAWVMVVIFVLLAISAATRKDWVWLITDIIMLGCMIVLIVGGT